MANRTTGLKLKRNKRIKREIIKELEVGLTLKEALMVVSERWYVSESLAKKIYYETELAR